MNRLIEIEGDCYRVDYIAGILLYDDEDAVGIILVGKPDPIRYLCNNSEEAKSLHAETISKLTEALRPKLHVA